MTAGTALLLIGASAARADTVLGRLPWAPDAGDPPMPVKPGPWQFFTQAEGAAVEAIADRIIPPDPQTPGGKDCGCAVFLDRQLAGPYGHRDGLYVNPPFEHGEKDQGVQTEAGPAQKYRVALAALDRACRASHGNRSFVDLTIAEQDALLAKIESAAVKLDDVDGGAFFAQMVKDIQMGFFADPVYGGNRGMAAWKMIGFPGARYNYLDWLNRPNERFPLPPVGITGRAEWSSQQP